MQLTGDARPVDHCDCQASLFWNHYLSSRNGLQSCHLQRVDATCMDWHVFEIDCHFCAQASTSQPSSGEVEQDGQPLRRSPLLPQPPGLRVSVPLPASKQLTAAEGGSPVPTTRCVIQSDGVRAFETLVKEAGGEAT